MSEGVGVLVVDDHPMFAQALEMLIEAEPDFRVVGVVGSGEEAVEAASSSCPDVVLMDIDLPGMSGIEATRLLVGRCPDTRIVVISALQPDEVLLDAIEAGAGGVISKTEAVDAILDVVRRASAGDVVLPPGDSLGLLRRLQMTRRDRSERDRRLDQLTDREVEILQRLAEAKTTDEVASALFISPHTVHAHMRSILRKLEARSKLEAVLLALRHGRVELPRP
ncbi:MAG TPA: response regulator transcription factor [Actinomycetota bacterium]|nr:response regulator transcription factor [Actinomycetota bacterium]